ncbi:MAG: 2TM domain-containing protein [Gaiellaceae bacterium]
MSATVPVREQATSEPAEPDELREEAIASLKRKRKFGEDVIAYISVNGVLWLIWALTDRSTDGGLPWPAWVSLVWGFFLAVDAWRTFGRWPRSLHRPITEEEIDRELRRIR